MGLYRYLEQGSTQGRSFLSKLAYSVYSVSRMNRQLNVFRLKYCQTYKDSCHVNNFKF